MSQPAESNLQAPQQVDPRFEQVWTQPPGLRGAIAEVNNQPLGIRFMVTSIVFFIIGGVMALLMRIQLAVPDNTFLDPQIYNQLFTMHGSTMMFLFAVPFVEGLAMYLLPMMIGSRDMAFPRLTSFGYWTYLAGGLLFYASFLFGLIPDAGWFSYTPLSGPWFAGPQQDFWLLGLSLVEVSGVAAAIEIVVTILKFRAPGMTLPRMPIFIWAILVTSIMILFAFTTLLMATILLELDRAIGTRFFDPAYGGSSLLWQHLFWFFGHPEVYIVFLPATGIVTMIVSAVSLRLHGYTLIVVALITTGFLSFGLWVHHMYTTGLPELSMHFFAAASLMIAMASGIQVFAWIATLWGTGVKCCTPFLYVLGFLFTFVLGGMTGVMVAVTPFDWQVHDTYFVVAHFHYVLIGGAVFPFLGGLWYWLPKITGRMLSETLGYGSFWLVFLGFHATFFPMHLMGFFGLPRRVYTYPSALQLESMNLLATGGTFVMAIGLAIFGMAFFISLWRGPLAGDNPWRGDSLEWSISSPPPVYTFRAPPALPGRHPMWHTAQQRKAAGSPWQQVIDAMTDMPTRWRGTLVTDWLSATPQAIQVIAGPTLVPVLTAGALVVMALGVLIKSWLTLLLGMALVTGLAIHWLQPRRQVQEMIRLDPVAEQSGLTTWPVGSQAVGWWGAVGLIAVLATAAAVMFYSYFYIRLFSEQWPQENLPLPNLLLPGGAYSLLVVSVLPQHLAMRQLRANRWQRWWAWLAAACALGIASVAGIAIELLRLPFTPQTNAYGSLVWVLTCMTGLLIVVGLAINAAALARGWRWRADAPRLMVLQMQISNLLWYAVAALAVAIYGVVHVSPYVI